MFQDIENRSRLINRLIDQLRTQLVEPAGLVLKTLVNMYVSLDFERQ